MQPTEIAEAVALPPEFDGIPVAVVGGFVRDGLRGVESHDVDLVVTETTPATLRERGFQPVEAESFPVFHDSLGREVALARTEETTGDGHTAFEATAVSPDIPHREALVQDLKRRDLTINAMAVDARTGELVDPHGGLEDLSRGIIRHVSDAFAEDPLRVLRAARFRARLGFDVADSSRDLMREVAPAVSTLPDDRLGTELKKTFEQAVNPRLFFDTLREVDALSVAFPEVAALVGVPAGPADIHREGDAFEHTMQVLTELHSRRPNDVAALLGGLAHDLGKGTTGRDVLPSHHGHAKRGGEIGTAMRRRLGLPRAVAGAMSVAARTHMELHRVTELDAETLLNIAKQIEGSPLTVNQLTDIVVADATARTPQKAIDEAVVCHRLIEATAVIEDVGGTAALSNRGISPAEVGESVPGPRVSDFIRQDRAEALWSRL